MAVKEISEAEFKAEVLDSQSAVVVDFNAEWCGPCKMLEPILHKVSDEITDVKFCSINTDDNQNIAMQYNITGIPCLIVFKGGQEVKRIIGLQQEEALKAQINEVK